MSLVFPGVESVARVCSAAMRHGFVSQPAQIAAIGLSRNVALRRMIAAMDCASVRVRMM